MENQNKALAEEEELIRKIQESKTDKIVSTVLKTDERVIARVTDGIYRQPASAIRELISNAYDADATRVVIKTDAPRFEHISVEDNGLGMSPQTLAHMLLHIGGSAKRNSIGKNLGITKATDSLSSPGGRKLIGKIGIGVFSVAQLTHNFQIITKVKGDKFRTVATVALKQYSDEGAKKDDIYESGKVNIWREKAKDVNSSGTTIVLTKIRPQAQDTLRSRSIWSQIEEAENTAAQDEHSFIEPPKYHVGRVDASGQLLKKSGNKTSNVPWNSNDSPKVAFNKLVDSIWAELDNSNSNPQLEKIFDYYLQMVWQISLSIPLPYVAGHLFDMNLKDWTKAFEITNQVKGLAKEIDVTKNNPIRKALNLTEGLSNDKFEVYFDELFLSRPIKYQGLPATGHAIKTPLVFLGKCKEEFKGIPIELSSGTLDFEAYLFWTPKLAPAEHKGALIRINGASGTLFDPTFMRYQVSEQTRLRQICCEIYVHQGFDSALNIDRESFNYAHPHAVFLTKWLHNALKQLATAQKRIASGLRDQHRETIKAENLNKIQNIANEVWKYETKDEDSEPPSVEIDDDKAKAGTKKKADIVLRRSAIMVQKTGRQTAVHKAMERIVDEKVKAITQVLASFGLLEKLSKAKQERLLKALYEILEASDL